MAKNGGTKLNGRETRYSAKILEGKFHIYWVFMINSRRNQMKYPHKCLNNISCQFRYQDPFWNRLDPPFSSKCMIRQTGWYNYCVRVLRNWLVGTNAKISNQMQTFMKLIWRRIIQPTFSEYFQWMQIFAKNAWISRCLAVRRAIVQIPYGDSNSVQQTTKTYVLADYSRATNAI